jgi:hypothetical protein
MFGDGAWLEEASVRQQSRLQTWLARSRRPVVLELGAGTAIASVRIFGEQAGCPLVRVNPREPEVALARDIGIALGAQDAIERIAAALL